MTNDTPDNAKKTSSRKSRGRFKHLIRVNPEAEDVIESRLEIESRLLKSFHHNLKDDSNDSVNADEKPRRKKFRKRGKKKKPIAKHASSCSCSSVSSNSGGDCSCCCCCSSSISCSSTDSDERFAKYYKLSSDEMELQGVDFPLESKKKRREMTKLLLHTMVMWDDIWTGKIKDDDKKTVISSSESTTTDSDYYEYQRKIQPGKGAQMGRKGKDGKPIYPLKPEGFRENQVSLSAEEEMLKELAISKRLRQTLALKQEHGTFFSGKWYGIPIEEIDPFIYDDTYVILSWRPKGPCMVYRFFKGDSLGLFAPDHPVRTFAFKLISHRYFNRLIVLTIFSNCISLAFERYDYTEYGKSHETVYDMPIAIVELIFLSIYSLEMVLKIIAKGFLFQKMSYLRNGWNLLDFTVVVTNYISLTLELTLSNDFDLDFEGTNLEFLRIFRVLRILKTISILPGLRKIVTALLNSSQQLFEVLGLTLFTVMMFSLFGMEFFSGRFRQKCVRIQGNTTSESFYNLEGVTIPNGLSNYMTDRLYGMWVENEHNWLWRDHPESEPVPCGNSSSARTCPDGYVCLEVAKSENPNHGWISFDNFFLAVLQTLQVMTLDYWERLYELTLSTVGWESILYYVLVIFFGGFYLLNLMLAVVTLSYDKEQNQASVNYINLPVQKRLRLTRDLSVFNFEHLNQQRLHLFEGFHGKSQRERDEQLLRMIKADEFAHPKMSGSQFEKSQQVTHAIYKLLGKVGRYTYGKSRAEENKKALEDLNLHRRDLPEDGFYDEFELFDGQSDAELVNEMDPNCIKLNNGKFCNFNLAGFDQTFIVPNKSRFVKRPINEIQFDLFPAEDKWESIMAWLMVWRKASQSIVEDWKWKNGMIFCIFVNTVISCLEHREQELWMDHLIHVSNDVFTYVFCFELGLKAIAYQNKFFQYGWNKFDFCVVVGSILDNLLQLHLGYKGLRGLKLLRILRLAQAWDTMKVLLNILFSAIGDMANLLLILFFAIYIFAMFGMQYIGSGYEPKNFMADYYPANYPRWAWQTSFHSFLMVFRVVSGEWVELTSECLSAFRSKHLEYKCFQTFIPMLVFGNFIVLNLFLALLLHIFDADEINSLSKSVKADRRTRGNSFRSNMNRILKRIKEKIFHQVVEDTGDGGPRRIRLALNLKRNKVTPTEPDTPVASTVDEASVGSRGSNASSRGATSVRFAHDDIQITDSGRFVTVKSTAPIKSQVPSQRSINTGSIPLKNEEEDRATTGDEGADQNKQYHLILPKPLPKWRFYKIVTKYVAVGEESDENDDEDLQTNDHDYPHDDPSTEEHIPNHRFRVIVFRVLQYLRKEKALIAINRYVAKKRKEKRQNFLSNKVVSRASKFSSVTFPDSAFSFKYEVEDAFTLDPCFPSHWFLSKICLPCWLWGSRSSACLDAIRMKCLRIVKHPWFEWIVLIMIFSSSALLCFDDKYLDDRPQWFKDFIILSGGFFTTLFFCEFFLQMLARGVYGYFTNPWLILDFCVVWIGLLSLIMDILSWTGKGHDHGLAVQLGSLKALRTLRCIRPLRAISRWQGMRIVVNSLLQAIPAIFNVFCVCLVFWLVFAIMGVQFFKGRFEKCVNHLGEIVDASVAPNRQVCCQKIKSHNFAWVNSFPNFDSVPEAYLSLLYLATFEGWMDVIMSGIDARDIDQQPLRDYDTYAYIYFGVFCLFGGFLTTKLFIGVIIDNFNMLKNRFEGNLYEALMSPNQLRYFRVIKKLGQKQTRIVLAKPNNPARLAFLEIAISQRTEFFMFIIIVLNMLVMCCDGYGNTVQADAILESLNAFFIFIYTLEAIVKIIGLGRYYFKSSWNIFDIVILAISTIDYGIGDLLHHNFPIPPSVVRLCRILRVGRVMRLMKSAKGIRRLVFALFVSIPALFNIGALLLLVMFIYSILGMSLFGNFGDGGAFDEMVNFETFPNAFLLLFRLITIAGWNDILVTLMPMDMICGVMDASEKECGDNCIGWSIAIFYVVTYILITNFVIVNMYIAIILENFDQATKEDEFEVTGDDVEIFLDKWALFDGEGTQFMELRFLAPFLDILEPPLRMKYPNQTAITALDIPIYRGGLVQIYDVMRNLIVFVIGNAEAGSMLEVQKIINKLFAKNFRQKRILPLVSTTRIWKVQHKAATYIQRFWRNYRAEKRRALHKHQIAEIGMEVPVQIMFNQVDERRGDRKRSGVHVK